MYIKTLYISLGKRMMMNMMVISEYVLSSFQANKKRQMTGYSEYMRDRRDGADRETLIL